MTSNISFFKKKNMFNPGTGKKLTHIMLTATDVILTKMHAIAVLFFVSCASMGLAYYYNKKGEITFIKVILGQNLNPGQILEGLNFFNQN
ncbi:hypothetical protein ACJX0J_009179, partial [Zea mays]